MKLRPFALDRHASFGITSSVGDAKPGANTLKSWVHKTDHIASSDEGCDSATGVPSNAQHGTSVVSPLDRLKSSH